MLYPFSEPSLYSKPSKLWGQPSPLSMDTPTADVIHRQSPLFFGHSDELLAAYPALEQRTGGRATVANAVLPMVLEGRALGVVVLDFLQAHDFLEMEQRFVRVLCAQCAVALGRIRQLQEQEQLVLERTAALSAFAALTEAVGSETDLRVLARQATEVLQRFLPELRAVYGELEDGRWVARVLSDNVTLEAATAARSGYAFETPIFLQAVQARKCTFIDGLDVAKAGLLHPESYGALAFCPYSRGGQPSSMLVVGTQQTRHWTDAGRAIVSAVGRSLGLALERAEYVRQKEAQQLAVLEARSRAEQAVLEAERQRSQAETMTHLAHHDALTGLPNRAGLSVRLKEAISAGTPFALFYLDLDGFKAVNDTLGHAAGDALLIQITAVLHREVISTDGHEQVLARIGGDEFTVMVSGVLDEDQSATLALGMRSALDQSFQVAGQTVFVTASTGITVFPGDGQTPEDLLQNADLAMYQVKRESKNGWRHYRAGMNEEARTRLQLASGLRGALGRDEFQLHYQPQFDLESGEVRCLEALLRWFPADGEVVSPAQFIPAAEASGLIVPIGQWVLDTACAQLAVWRKGGFPGLRVAVNVSPVQLACSGLLEGVQGALDRAGLEASALELELTERGVLADLPGVLEQFRALRRLGVKTALDDFGAGESNLGRLLHLPFDVLKLDRNLITTLSEQPEARRFMHALEIFASSLNLELVAEGIETPAQLEAVRALGCHRAQGYLLGRPAAVWPPPDEE